MDLLDVRHVPSNISRNLPSNLAMEQVVPQNFSDIIDIYNEDDAIVINMIQAESHNNIVKISSKIFNPEANSVVFPRFILQISTLFNHQINYWKDYPFLILNQNQLLYLVIHHRLSMIRNNKVHYADLLKKDIAKISNYGEYATYSTTNAKLKSENSYIILNVFEPSNRSDLGFEFRDSGKSGRPSPIGEMLNLHGYTKSDLMKIFRDLPVQPASEGMASESNKFVISDHGKPFYKAVGYGLFKGKSEILKQNQILDIENAKANGLPIPHLGNANGEYFFLKSIFNTTKPNIPARFKSHIASDAYCFPNPSAPIFKEDIVDFDQMLTDGTKIDAFVVFDEINSTTDYLTCGEAEVSKTFASKLVYKDEIIKGIFKTISVKAGDEFSGVDAKMCIIGTDEDDKEIILPGFKNIKIISVEDTGINNSYKIVARCKRQIGAGRLYSATGLKAMTKPRNSLGKAVITLPDGSTKSMNVDIVAGMNAIKGKENSIMLAKAALMFRLGFANKAPYLDSMNEKQINQVANQFSVVDWTDRNGNTKKVIAGIIQVSVNELAYMFNNVKYQSFMAESGRYLAKGGKKELFEYIWEHNIDPDDRAIIEELKKIATDKIGCYVSSDNLPVYSPDGIRELGIFDVTDLKFEKKPIIPHVSKLIDEDYNKGFYLDLRYRNGGMVRFPSAKLLNHFTARTPSGDWIYPQLLINISNCLQCCLVMNDSGQYNYGFLNDKEGKKNFRVENYYTQVMRVLHTEQNFASRLVKPRVLGINMKQMVDCSVPKGTIVIFDSRVYKELAAEAGYGWEINAEGEVSIPHFLAMCVRNPVIWKSQLQVLKVWSKEHFRKHLASKGIDMDQEFVVKFCKELLMMNPMDALIQQSDVDGDIMPVFVPKGIKGQELMSEMYQVGEHDIYGVKGIVEEEVQWLEKYRQGEHSNEDLKANEYKLFRIPFSYSENNAATYLRYFADSIIAKGDVGLATHNNWTLQTGMEIAKIFCDQGKIKDHKGKAVGLSEEELCLFTYIYSRIVQDLVVRGIKHNDGGSNEFKPFLLANMSTSEYSGHVVKVLRDIMGINAFAVNKFIFLIHWLNEEVKVVESIMKFISLHNKGSIPVEYNEGHFNYIVDNTYYGQLVKPLYDIHRDVYRKMTDGYEYQGRNKDVPIKKSRAETSYEAMSAYGLGVGMSSDKMVDEMKTVVSKRAPIPIGKF